MAFAYLYRCRYPQELRRAAPAERGRRNQAPSVRADAGLPVTLCTSHPSNEIVEAVIKALAASCPDRAMAGWSRRFRIAIQGKIRATAAISSGTCSRRARAAARVAGRRRLVVDRRMAPRLAASSSVRSRSRRGARPCRTSAATNFRAGSWWRWPIPRGGLGVALDLVLEIGEAGARQHRVATARALRPVRHARRRGRRAAPLLACSRRTARRACCAPLKSASQTPPHRLPSKYAPPAAAAGGPPAQSIAAGPPARPPNGGLDTQDNATTRRGAPAMFCDRDRRLKRDLCRSGVPPTETGHPLLRSRRPRRPTGR